MSEFRLYTHTYKTRYTSKRRSVAKFLAQNPRTDSKYAERVAMNLGIKGPLLRSPFFVGGRPQLTDPTIEGGKTEADLIELVCMYRI